MVLYIDVLVIINFIADYMLLLVTAKICAVYAPRWRLGLAAAAGAGYAAAAELAGGFLALTAMRIAAGLALVFIAFGAAKSYARLSLVFFAVSAGFAGAVFAASYTFGVNAVAGLLSSPTVFVLAAVFVLSYAVFSLVFSRTGREGGGTVSVTLRLGSRSAAFTALRDTGNSLSDPLTGKRVLVADMDKLSVLFPEEVRAELRGKRDMDPVELAARLNECSCGCVFRLVPYRAVGNGCGLLPAFKPDGILIDGRENGNYIVAMSPNEIGDGGAYSALIGAA